MSVRDTSILAWQANRASGLFKTQKEGVYQAVSMIGGMTRRRISQVTGYEIGAICGAVHKLIEEHRLVDGKIVECETTHRPVHLVELPSQLALAI